MQAFILVIRRTFGSGLKHYRTVNCGKVTFKDELST